VRFQRVDVKVDALLLTGSDEVFYFVNWEGHV
jgi:hypothetical protein